MKNLLIKERKVRKRHRNPPGLVLFRCVLLTLPTKFSELIEHTYTYKNMKQTIRLTESELKEMIEMSINEAMENEGWLGNKWKQTKSAVGSAFNNDDSGLKQKLQNAKNNWVSQGELKGISSLRQQLTQMLDARQISPDTTVAQLVGGKYNNNKFGRMTGMEANRRNQIKRRGGNAY